MAIWHNLLVGPDQTGGGQALASCLVELADGSTVDIAGDILHEAGGLTIQGAGRQTELQPSEPGAATLTVDNSSGDYTPGRAAAAAALDLGLPVRYRETIGRKTFDLFTGALNQPQATLRMLPNGAGDTVQVTATDWVGQQQGSPRRFVSNLGEWVLYHGGDALVGYWPMTETAKPFLPAVDTANAPIVAYDLFGSSSPPVSGDTYITAASTVMPLGEDARIATIGGPLDSAGLPAHSYHAGVRWATGVRPRAAAGEVITVVAWIDPVRFDGATQELLDVSLLEDTTNTVSSLSLKKDSTTNIIGLIAFGGSLTGSFTGGGIKSGRPYPVAIRYGCSPSVFEMWVDRTRYTGSLSGSPPTGLNFYEATSGFTYQGGFGHLQVYAGAAADWTFQDYLAQIDHASNGLTGGLRWQRTDDRIRTLARYAGLTDAELDLDVGCAYMPRASLAGSSFTDAARVAVDTEQGRLFNAGDGNLRFHNRIRTHYNF